MKIDAALHDALGKIGDETKRLPQKGKGFAVVLAGHNGSGKSTLWNSILADRYQMPLINADRMMLSILPEKPEKLPNWAKELRDNDEDWMLVARDGVQAFVARAQAAGVAFAMETVFSHWKVDGEGRIVSKISMIRELQRAGYFVLLVFVGLASAELSIGRVATRVNEGGHAVPEEKLRARFPRTQKAIREAALVADATLMLDNSRGQEEAFTLCHAQLGSEELYDLRKQPKPVDDSIRQWLDVVSPA